jgi:hypothetical protein
MNDIYNLEYFSLLQRIEIGSGALICVAWPGHGADYSPTSSAETKNKWFYASCPPLAFMS